VCVDEVRMAFELFRDRGGGGDIIYTTLANIKRIHAHTKSHRNNVLSRLRGLSFNDHFASCNHDANERAI